MAEKSIDDWIDLLADRSKVGNIGEYFHREQCAELLELLVELKDYREQCAELLELLVELEDYRKLTERENNES